MNSLARTNWPVVLGVAVLVGFAGYAALFIAPDESAMAQLGMQAIQRIFYFHVPSAWTAFTAFFTVFICNIAYLARRDLKWDWLAVSAAEVGQAFCTAVLVTGPIWAKPVWGTWWAWDARLTSTLVLWLMYVSYLLLRSLLPDSEKRARISAVFGIFAFLDVPLVYFSIWLWRTHHPQPVIGGGGSLHPTMRWVLLLCWAALLSVMILLLRQRYRLERMRHEVEGLAHAAEERAR